MDLAFFPQLLTSTVECGVIFPLSHIYSSTSGNERKKIFLGIDGVSIGW